MRVYIADAYGINSIILPTDIEDSYLLKYTIPVRNITVTINIEKKNGLWVIVSDGYVNLVDSNSNIINNAELIVYNRYNIFLPIYSVLIRIYCTPIIENNIFTYKTIPPSISMGSVETSNIIYGNTNIYTNHCNFVYENAKWYIQDLSNQAAYIYLNDVRVVNSELQIGDVLFIEGLKIVWMGHYFSLNNPLNLVKLNSLSIHEEVKQTDHVNLIYNEDKVLYKEEDYFSHRPLLGSPVEDSEVTIDAPPPNQVPEDNSLLLTIGSTITLGASSLMSGYNVVSGLITGMRTVAQSIPAIVMTASMLIGSLLIPRIVSSQQKKRQRKKEKLRQEKYTEYIGAKEIEINNIRSVQSQVLLEDNISTKDCISVINSRTRMLWNRVLTNEKFLSVRLGKGNVPANIKINSPEKKFTLDEDNLLELVYEMCERSKDLKDVPVSFSFKNHPLSALIYSDKYKDDYIGNLLLQLMTLHSPNDLKIIMLTSEDNNSFDYLKYSPHNWSDNKEIRFFAKTTDDAMKIGSFLEEEMQKRKDSIKDTSNADDFSEKFDNIYQGIPPYYFIITDDYFKKKNVPFLNSILNSGVNLGFSLLVCDDELKNIPNKCDNFLFAKELQTAISFKTDKGIQQQKVSLEVFRNINMLDICVKLFNVPIKYSNDNMLLPEMLEFLNMFGVSKIEQLNIQNRWKESNPTNTLSTPVGVHTNQDIFKLDLHEKFHGPHGLVAGMTGSGKSEFIITYILSMAINYHPDEVQFVLIDYKGGGLAGAFENKEKNTRLPHIVGTITNLDDNEMNRSLVSINSELRRRQRLFNEARDALGESTIDIYKYQRLYREGLIKEPISHLFIVSDEFAELKSQQPEFMQELISTARIGRSLGVHLILATQKPSGVVNDQIWSNSKFKVCLKVQDRSDSMEMLKKPDAASLKEVGRFYLQVGYDEYFDIGQSAWSGAKYKPTDRVHRKVDDSIEFVDNIGTVIRSINEKSNTVEKDIGDELTNIVKRLLEISTKQNIVTRRLWLDPIPDVIYLGNLINKYSFKVKQFAINAILGEYDNPNDQEQGLLTVNFNDDGNLLVYGINGSGKGNLLITMLYSLIVHHHPSEVNIYITDCGGGTLGVFRGVPHVGDVFLTDDTEKVMSMFAMVENEFERRKNLFADYGGSYQNYCETSGKTEPLIICVINDYDNFVENYGKLPELLIPLYRDGNKYGIIFVITATSSANIRMRMSQYFMTKIAMEQPESNDYRTLVNAPKGLVPLRVFGRGVVTTVDNSYEFQTSLITTKNEINTLINSTKKKLSESYQYRAKKTPFVPDIVRVADLLENIDGSNIPIGIDIQSKRSLLYDFSSNIILPVLAVNQNANLSFLDGLLAIALKSDAYRVEILDFSKIYEEKANYIYHNSNYDDALNKIWDDIHSDVDVKKIYVFIGLGAAIESLSYDGRRYFDALFKNASLFPNTNFIVYDSSENYNNIISEPWSKEVLDRKVGIWLGEGMTNQISIDFANATLQDRQIMFDYMAFINKNNVVVPFKYVVNIDSEDEDAE